MKNSLEIKEIYQGKKNSYVEYLRQINKKYITASSHWQYL